MRITRRSAFGLLSAAVVTPAAATPKRETGWTPPRTFDLEQTWPWIKSYRRTAIRLHPEASAQPLPPAASKIGGAFLWPSNEAWPFCRERDPEHEINAQTWEDFREHQREFKLMERMVKPGTNLKQTAQQFEQMFEREKAKGLPPLTSAEAAEACKALDEMNARMAQMRLPHHTAYLPVIQLRRDEFPELLWPTGKDVFQLLWCPRVHWEGNGMHDPDEPPHQSPGFVLKWRAARLVGPVLTKPPKPRESPGLVECVLHPEEIAEYPQAEEFGRDEIKPHLDRLASQLLARRGGSEGTDAHWRYSYGFHRHGAPRLTASRIRAANLGAIGATPTSSSAPSAGRCGFAPSCKLPDPGTWRGSAPSCRHARCVCLASPFRRRPSRRWRYCQNRN